MCRLGSEWDLESMVCHLTMDREVASCDQKEF